MVHGEQVEVLLSTWDEVEHSEEAAILPEDLPIWNDDLAWFMERESFPHNLTPTFLMEPGGEVHLIWGTKEAYTRALLQWDGALAAEMRDEIVAFLRKVHPAYRLSKPRWVSLEEEKVLEVLHG